MPAWSVDVSAVLFDMDGTLVDSTAAVARSWLAWADRWQLGGRFSGYDHGRPARQLIAELIDAERVDEAFQDIEATEIADVSGIVPLPGAAELLASLPTDRWAIVTSSTAPLAAARLAAAGITPPVLVTASDIEHGKPAPDAYLLAARRLGADPADCLVVEDAPAGVASGRAAGSHVLGLLGTVPAEALRAADAVAPGLSGVRAVTREDRIRVTATNAV